MSTDEDFGDAIEMSDEALGLMRQQLINKATVYLRLVEKVGHDPTMLVAVSMHLGTQLIGTVRQHGIGDREMQECWGALQAIMIELKNEMESDG